MQNNIKIAEIHSIFIHHKTDYILFSLNHNKFNYLYLLNSETQNKSLLFGNNLIPSVLALRNKLDIECIECHLCRNIIGGISLDGKDLIESNLSVEEANAILTKLKDMMNPKVITIQLF